MPSRPPLLDMHRVTVMRGAKTVLRDLSLRVAVGENTSPSSDPTAAANRRSSRPSPAKCYPLARPESQHHAHGPRTLDRSRAALHRSALWNSTSPHACSRSYHRARPRALWPGRLRRDSGRTTRSPMPCAPRPREVSRTHRRSRISLQRAPSATLSSGELRRLVIARARGSRSARACCSTSLPTASTSPPNTSCARPCANSPPDGIGIVLVTHHLADIIPEIERVVLMARRPDRSRRRESKESSPPPTSSAYSE
jgi:iron complex transport system ATP-binding protein